MASWWVQATRTLHVALPVLWVLIGLAVIAALMSWANCGPALTGFLLAAAVLVFGSAFALAEVLPASFERLYRET